MLSFVPESSAEGGKVMLDDNPSQSATESKKH